MGSNERVTAKFRYDANTRSLMVSTPIASTKSMTRTWNLPVERSDRGHALKPYTVKTRVLGGPQVIKAEPFPGGMIYHYQDKAGTLTNSSKKPAGVAFHRVQIPADQKINPALLRDLVEKTAGVGPSGSVWSLSN